MRRLLLVVAVLLPLGCRESTPTRVGDKDVQVKDNGVDLEVGLPKFGRDKGRESKPAPELPSLAVMPFKAPSGTQAVVALAETMTASVTRTLSRNEGLDVRAQSVVAEYKHNEPVQAGRFLKVRAVLSADVKLVPENFLVVSLELVEVATGRQLWGEVYKEKYDADKVKEVEDKVIKDASDAVAEKLGAKVARKEIKESKKEK